MPASAQVITTPVLPAQPLQASKVGTAGPILHGLPDPELEGQDLETRAVTPPTTNTEPIPGSATSLLTFALQILKTPAGSRGHESHIDGVLWNFHEALFCPVLSKILVSPCYHQPTSRLRG